MRNKREKVLIFGAGGHGKVVLDILLESGTDVQGFIDDDKSKAGKKVRGFKILGGWSCIEKGIRSQIALGIGDNVIRKNVFNRAKRIGLTVIFAVHPKAVVSKDVKIGEGVVIMPGAIVNPGVVLEDGVVINTAASVDHDCRLEKFCQIWPGAHLAGSVKVGEFSYIGTGVSVIPNIKIGKKTIVGAGAVVICDAPDNVTIVGNPGRVIKTNG